MLVIDAGHQPAEVAFGQCRSRRRVGVWVARVYVSSTVADLAEERRTVLDWLRLARHQAVDSYLPDANPEGLSITQLEFRRAGECGIPRVALLRTSVPDVSTSDLLDPARAPLGARVPRGGG